MRRWFWLFVPVLSGCPIDVADVDTDIDDDAPDITGDYVVAPLTEVEGCEGVAAADPVWMEGAMTIEGSPDALSFTFSGGEQLLGSVDTAFTWEAEGTVPREGTDVEVVAEGLAFIGDETWILSGDVLVEVPDSTGSAPACMLSGRLEAEQDPP